MLLAIIPRMLHGGTFAAAMSDTWARELGRTRKVVPKSLRYWRYLVPGASGAVSTHGAAGAVVGAFVMASCAVAAFTVPFDIPPLKALFVGWLAGALADWLLGATVQSVRWRDTGGEWTGRRVHTWGYRSHHRTGLRWMNADAVNVPATAVGGLRVLLAWRP